MPSILICCNPVDSHLAPTLEVARAFVQRRWRVRLLTAERFADAVRAVGAIPLSLPSELNRMDPAEDAARGLQAVNDSIFDTFYTPADVQFAAIRHALDAEPADVVGGDPTFTGLQLVSTMPDRPIVALASFLPLMVSSRDTAPFGTGLPPMSGPVGRFRNRALLFLTRRILLRSVHRKIDAFYRDHGMPGLGAAFFADYFVVNDGLLDLYGQLGVAGFEYPRRDLSPVVRFFGPALPPPPDHRELPSWWSDLEDGRPVVVVTQGTVANLDLDELVMPTLHALAGQDVLVVATIGRAELDAGSEIPANARVAEHLPYDLLLPRASVFVTNGGYGGLNAALAHGVPIVAAGDTQDKVETCARVAWSGSGVNLRTGRPTSASIGRAVREVLDTPAYAEAASRLSEEIAASPGPAGFAAAVADLVERRSQLVTS